MTGGNRIWPEFSIHHDRQHWINAVQKSMYGIGEIVTGVNVVHTVTVNLVHLG